MYQDTIMNMPSFIKMFYNIDKDDYSAIDYSNQYIVKGKHHSSLLDIIDQETGNKDKNNSQPCCIFILGAGAVGKASIAQKIADKTGYINMHNHIFIEPVHNMFGNDFSFKLVEDLREITKDYIVEHKLSFIQTYVMYFNNPWHYAFILQKQLELIRFGYKVMIIELDADYETRIKRNRMSSRIEMKPSKKDISYSQSILEKEQKNQLQTSGSELSFWCLGDMFLKIDTTNLNEEETFKIIYDNLLHNINID